MTEEQFYDRLVDYALLPIHAHVAWELLCNLNKLDLIDAKKFCKLYKLPEDCFNV